MNCAVDKALYWYSVCFNYLTGEAKVRFYGRSLGSSLAKEGSLVKILRRYITVI